MIFDEFGRMRMLGAHGTAKARIVYKGNTKVKVARPDPMEEAQAQMRILREQAAIAEEQRLAQEAREKAAYEADLAKFNTTVGNLYSTSLDQGESRLLRDNLDTDYFLPLLTERLDAARLRIPELTADPGAYFNLDTMYNTLINDETARKRRSLNQELDAFAAPGFATSRVADTMDDPILNAILGEQYADASTSIMRARDRGNLSDFGFQTALGNLDTQKSTALSRLQGLGGGILEGFRTSLRDIAEQGRSRADAFQFGDAYDPSTTRSALETAFADRSGRLEGDIRSALGGERLFNVGDILGRASTAQGAQNETRASPIMLAALAAREEDRAKRRGIGSQGVF